MPNRLHFEGQEVFQGGSAGTTTTVSKRQSQNQQKGPKLWQQPSMFVVNALNSPWYSDMFAIQDTLYHGSVDFFRNEMDYNFLIVPVTTASISSPMGLGSDSQPVTVELDGAKTYLADSQQFLLEYALRLKDDIKGSYYVGTSCRGEDPDATHLNQFCHVECELMGPLADGIRVADGYVVSLIQSLLSKNRDLITRHAGSTAHMESVLALYTRHGNAFPQVTLDAALALPFMSAADKWQWAVDGHPEFGRSLTRAGEQALIAHFGGAVWVVEMDHLSVPFYQAYADPQTKRKALCGDLLLGLGETIGCGQRHVSADQALGALKQHQVDPDLYKWYLEMREVKPFETTGWGIGTERFLCWVLQHDDCRDIPVIPRLKGHDVGV